MDNTYRALKVVIADDDATTRHALRLLLTDQGHSVVGEAGDGEKAVDMCATREPDIAFLDINMPKLDGHGAAQRIREAGPRIGMIMISGTPTLDHVQRALQAGVSGFVVKPFNATKVMDAIHHCLKQRR